MKLAGILPLLITVAAAPVLAAPPAAKIATAQEDTAEEVEHLHLPGFDGRPSNSSSIEFEIAPEIASHNPLGSDSRTSTTTDMTLVFATTHSLSDNFEVEFDAGPWASFDGSDVTTSSVAAGLEFRSRPGESGFAGFASYSIEREFENFFGDGLDTIQTAKAGLRYGTSIGPAEIGFELAPRWVNSSHDLDDYLAGELFVDAVFPLGRNGIDFIAEMALDRRWYREVDPIILEKQRQWRFEVFTGLDFADALAPASGRENPVKSLGVGLLWLEVNSNLDSADRSSFKVLPAVSVGASF